MEIYVVITFNPTPEDLEADINPIQDAEFFEDRPRFEMFKNQVVRVGHVNGGDSLDVTSQFTVLDKYSWED